MSTQHPTVTTDAISSQMSFEYSDGAPTAATATHDATVDETTYEVTNDIDHDLDSGRITVTRTGSADGESIFQKTTHIASLTQAAASEDVSGSPQSFVGLVTTLHYHPSPEDQLTSLVNAAVHSN